MTAINTQALQGMTQEQLIALVTSMAAQPATARKLTFKVGDKGGVCIYGLGRFPVHAYASQWERILEVQDELKAFMVANTALLARKV